MRGFSSIGSEHPIVDRKVAGSNPVGPAKHPDYPWEIFTKEDLFKMFDELVAEGYIDLDVEIEKLPFVQKAKSRTTTTTA
jgi:hypothetical protein